MTDRRSDRLAVLHARLSEAAVDPAAWPAALEAVAGALGAVGAAYILSDNSTGRVEWASFVGPSADRKADYIDHYAGLDPYRPRLDAAPIRQWLRLSECLPDTVLRRSEWYNDFVVRAGVGDILGVRLFASPARTVIFGIHRGLYQRRFDPMPARQFDPLVEALAKSARLHTELRDLGWKSAVALQALDRLAAGVIVTDGEGRVFEMNSAAECIVQRADGLKLGQGKLAAVRGGDDDKLASFIATAAAPEARAGSIGRMLVGRRGTGRRAYALVVAPLGTASAVFDRPLAMILVTDPDGLAPSERDVAEFFGLSPAESRLAAALLAGKRLRGLAADTGVQISTLRTQLSSILEKVGVERQTDLVRVLASVPVVTVPMPETK
jgi:DNA-binding CsgD family transcriptional regulator/PAS domain-containing protein